jgi:hypothetical protein
MNRQDIIGRLLETEAALRQRGVGHIALFGSRARRRASRQRYRYAWAITLADPAKAGTQGRMCHTAPGFPLARE